MEHPLNRATITSSEACQACIPMDALPNLMKVEQEGEIVMESGLFL